MTNLKIKNIEVVILLSLLGTWFVWFTGEHTPKGNELIIVFVIMVLMNCCIMLVSSWKASKKDVEYITGNILQNINDLVISMYSNGYRLKLTNNSMYVFETGNILFPNQFLIVRDFGDYCSVTARSREVKILMNAQVPFYQLSKKEETRDVAKIDGR